MSLTDRPCATCVHRVRHLGQTYCARPLTRDSDPAHLRLTLIDATTCDDERTPRIGGRMTIQDELRALPRLRYAHATGAVLYDEGALLLRLAIAERLLRSVLDSGLEPGGRDYGMVAVKIADYEDARAYLAHREAEK